MTKEDIELTVLTTMAEATVSTAERHQLITRVESARYNELMRFERKKQGLLRMILYVLLGILVVSSLQPLVPLLASLPSEHHVGSPPPSTDKQWWDNLLTKPAYKQSEKHSP